MSTCTDVDATWTLRRGEDYTATWQLMAVGGATAAPYVVGEIVELAFGELGTTGGEIFKLSTENINEALATEGSALVRFFITGEQVDLLTNDSHQADVWRITDGRRKHVGQIEVRVLPRVNNTPGA